MIKYIKPMDNPRVHLIFRAERDFANNVVFYTVVGVPVEGPTLPVFPERSFTTIGDLEQAMALTIAPNILAKIRHALEGEGEFILEVDAQQAAAIQLFSM